MPHPYKEVMYLAGQHSNLLCCPDFSFSFNGLLVLVLLQFPDKVPNNLDFLPPVAAGFVRRRFLKPAAVFFAMDYDCPDTSINAPLFIIVDFVASLSPHSLPSEK